MTDERIIHDIQSTPASLRGCVLTIGNFDGVHLGHRRILSACRVAAQSRPVVAMTFDPLPEAVLLPGDTTPLILPLTERCRRLAANGADGVIVLKTTPSLLALSAQRFVDDLLIRHLAPTLIVEGPYFRFGRRREGDLAILETMGQSRGFAVSVVDAARAEGILNYTDEGLAPRISSTQIREFIRQGLVEHAAACLGEPFTLFGRVVAGQRRGRVMGFPTINVQPGDQAIPGDGVYAGTAHIAGRRHLAAVSVGTNATFHEPNAPAARTVEAFLLDAAGDFYDKEVQLSFHRRLRNHHRFDSPEALKQQIARDVEEIRKKAT